MPWRECKRMDERLRFVARLLEGEKMASLCREFGISRPTGYKIFNRYRNLGLEGLIDRSRRPYRQANRLPFQVERTIVALRLFAGQFVGIREVADKIWLVSFLDFDLGFFDEVAARVEPRANPFASKVLTMCSV